uniref:immunoglobulin lambda-1 light chain-like isoform X2 n=1 Tax=Scatophagus argus TaxID=75038 RepID=UPI001ED85F5F|nr:immunoglobulin lambda-1 light chain-like isoform X2 [Scatophagus argus]
MLFLPAAALCCLCSALAAMAAQLTQDQLSLTRRVSQSVSFSCGGTDQCYDNDVYWYQKKDTETFRRILYLRRSSCSISYRYDHPQKNDFSVVREQNGCELKIQTVKLLHSATYYCACWKSGGYWYLIFGSGTKLYVTDEEVVKPVVSVYPAAHLDRKGSLLCVASHMFPPRVKISWKRRKKTETVEKVLPHEGDQLKLKESGCTAAIRLVDDLDTYKYRCYIEHEGGTVEAQTEQELPALPPTVPPSLPSTTPPPPPATPSLKPTAAPSLPPTASPSLPPTAVPSFPPSTPPTDFLQSQCRVKLLCVLYTVLIVKSLVYCYGLSLLMILRNKGPSTSCTHAD